MFGQLQSMFESITSGTTDPQALEQAAREHIESTSPSQLQDHLTTAAQNAGQSGAPDLAAQIESIIAQARANPQLLIAAVVTLIKDNPQVLSHFDPAFAKSIMGRLQSYPGGTR